MPGLTLLANVRPTFNAGAKTLTFELPDAATKGRLLLLVVAFDPADDFAALADWTVLDTYAGTSKVVLLSRMVDDNEPKDVELALTTAAKDWLGQLLVYEPGSPNVVLEASAGGDFAADATPPAPLVACQQALNLDVRVWSVDGAVGMTAPAGMTAIDSSSSAAAAARSLLIASVTAGASGNLAAKDAAGDGVATGSGVSYVLRDRAPITPELLVDTVPGNIGLVGKDPRPARETARNTRTRSQSRRSTRARAPLPGSLRFCNVTLPSWHLSRVFATPMLSP